MEKKKINVIIYTILMFFLFVIIAEGIIWGPGGRLIVQAIYNYPQGSFVISEAVLAVLVLIVMLLFKNSYVFTQKREKVSTGLFYGLFYIIGSILFIILFGFAGKGFTGGLSLVNLVIGSFLVGVCEEFLCRGWLLNEFLERYGDSKKGIWYSIIISATIFGLMHLGNIFSIGQGVYTTISQVLNALGIGIVFGVIYYKTKNIWSVVLLHGLWDFSLLLNDIMPVTETTELTMSFSIIGIIFGVLVVLSQLLVIIPYINNIDEKPKKKAVIGYSILAIVFYLLFTMGNGLISSKMGNTYTFENLSLENYAVIYDNYDKYEMSKDNTKVLLETVDDKLVLLNETTKYEVELDCKNLIDYIIMEDGNYYILGYIDYVDSVNVFLKYVYINKDNINDSNKFMDSVKDNMHKYLLSGRAELVVIDDRENNKNYLSAYSSDYGHYVLINEEQMAILNRD